MNTNQILLPKVAVPPLHPLTGGGVVTGGTR